MSLYISASVVAFLISLLWVLEILQASTMPSQLSNSNLYEITGWKHAIAEIFVQIKKSCSAFTQIFIALKIWMQCERSLRIKSPIANKGLLQNIEREEEMLKGHRDTWGGPNHLEKRGLGGSSHTYWEMTENIWDHSQTHTFSLLHTHTHTNKTFTHIFKDTHCYYSHL